MIHQFAKANIKYINDCDKSKGYDVNNLHVGQCFKRFQYELNNDLPFLPERMKSGKFEKFSSIIDMIKMNMFFT